MFQQRSRKVERIGNFPVRVASRNAWVYVQYLGSGAIFLGEGSRTLDVNRDSPVGGRIWSDE
jgi:hypothetical protein